MSGERASMRRLMVAAQESEQTVTDVTAGSTSASAIIMIVLIEVVLLTRET